MNRHAQSFDDAVVGAGILGLAHAYHLARAGRRVVVFERGPRASGASVRNFGMLWPIGQPPGPLRDLALRSLGHWREVLGRSGLWHEPVGSLHLAYHDDEAQVLAEFAALGRSAGIALDLLTPHQVLDRSPVVRPTGLRAGLWSPLETCVDPREVIARLPGWLERTLGVEFVFGRAVAGYDGLRIEAGGDGQWRAGRLWVCSGSDLETLYPAALQSAGLTRCKLQMMRSEPLEALRIGPMLAAGLTLRHYHAFAACPTLASVKERIARDSPEFDRYGIHVLVSQNGRGEVVIGDSHEDADTVGPFDNPAIDDLILGYLDTFLEVPGLRVAARWHGVYSRHAVEPFVVLGPAPGVTAVTGVGGAGMTLSFGLAERVVGDLLSEGGERHDGQ